MDAMPSPISFESEFVQLTIFSLNGQRVKSLVNSVQQPGHYQVSWSGINEQSENVSTGVYFVKLKVGLFTNIRKIILVK